MAEAREAAGAVPDNLAMASATDFQRDLSRYWRYVRARGELGLTTKGWVYKAVFSLLLQAVNVPADAPDTEEAQPRLWFMRQMLVALRELSESNARIVADPIGRFFKLPLAERIRRTFEAWRDTGAWDEFAGSGNAHRSSVAVCSKTRGVVLRALARAEKAAALERLLHPDAPSQLKDAWISAAYLVDHLLAPDLSRAAEQSRLLNRPAILLMLAGPLHWLGLADLGFAGRPDGALAARLPEAAIPIAYRLTDVGLWLLDLGGEPPFAEHGGRVLVQPNFTILAMQPISDTVLMDLDVFADLQASDQATTYHLTRQSVYRAQRSGWDVGRIVGFLEAHQGGPLPANVRRSLDEWHQLHNRIVIHRNACVIQSADDSARAGAREAIAPVRLKLSTLGGHYDLIEPSRSAHAAPIEAGLPAQVASALAGAGWMPQISPAGAGDIEGCLRIVAEDDAPGEFAIVFKPIVPSLFALGQLASFTQPAPDTAQRLRLTAASVRAALSGGMSLDEILAMLAHLHDGPLPAQVEAGLRGWARFYGRASASTVCLIEFSDQDVLNNLLDDEAVSIHLSPIDGSLKPLATVDAAHIDDVRELIEARGIEMA